jgi:hypothetical protein
MTEKLAGLELLRAPFKAHQISKLPKPIKKDAPKGRCSECGGWHGLPAVHLDYVGHAALTDRLLDADSAWTWEPLAMSSDGLPVMDNMGGMWIKLTVAGVTRIGYGHAGDKSGGDAIKEVIGDALRNAAMRFGAALDLWHKGDLHKDEPEQNHASLPLKASEPESTPREKELAQLADFMVESFNAGHQLDALRVWTAADTFGEDVDAKNQEKLVVWKMLNEHSKLRTFLNANTKTTKPPIERKFEKAGPDVGDGENMP